MVTWALLQSSFMDDPALHWEYSQSEQGLDCPFEVFTPLFHESVGTPAVPAVTAQVDWAAVRWSIEELSGEALAQVHIDRQFEHGVDEAYRATLKFGVADERPPVLQAWESQQSWIVPPVQGGA